MTGGGSHPSYTKISQDVIKVLLSARLITREKQALTITNEGFQFLLANSTEQIATLAIHYCSSLQDDSEFNDVISLLFMLSFLSPGKIYPFDNLTKIQRKHLSSLEDYGLVVVLAQGFIPTGLSSLLSSSGDSSVSLDKTEGFLVIETNYKVYAYTGKPACSYLVISYHIDSPLQFSILSLFMKVKTRFPNMIYAVLQQESVHEALKRGITASQIIKFLTSNCHTIMRGKVLLNALFPILTPLI